VLSERLPHGNVLRAPAPGQAERFDTLVASGELEVERIVSAGHATPHGEWLDQDRDEWVVLLEGQAELSFEDGSRLALGPGDYVLIEAGERHRVERTRVDPPCVWLAVHGCGLAAEVGRG